MKKKLIFIFIATVIFSCGTSRLHKGDEAMNEKKYDLAIEYYKEFINENPGAEEIPEAKEKINLCYYKKGIDLYKKGDLDGAIESFSRAKTKEAFKQLCNIYMEQGNKEFQAKNYKKAVGNYEMAKQIASEGKINLPPNYYKEIANVYFNWAEDDFNFGNIKEAKEIYLILAEEYDESDVPDYPKIFYRLFRISYDENNYDKAVQFLDKLKNLQPKIEFTEKDNEAFSKMISKFIKDADLEFKNKNFTNASKIIERASVLPNFDPYKKKQLKARIIFEEGKNLIETGKIDDGLKKFQQAKEVDINIGTEILNLGNRYIKDAQNYITKKSYNEAIEKFLLAKRISPENSEISNKYLPETYYQLANYLFLKKDYKGSLDAIKKGMEYNKNYPSLIQLYNKWDNTVNALKNKTLSELKEIMNYVEEQYRNAVAFDLILGKYKNKQVKWQAKILGMEEHSGKSYAIFKIGEITFYGIPTEKLDAQRFAQSCDEFASKKFDAVISGKISYIEEFLGIKNIVVQIDAISFVEEIE